MEEYKDTWIESTRSFEMRDCWYHYKEGRNWISFKAILYKLEWIVCYVLCYNILVKDMNFHVYLKMTDIHNLLFNPSFWL